MTWLNDKLIITMGTGGVGKTTISACMAIRAANEGKKVLVMTIDPSKRLKDALGIKNTEGSVEKIILPNAKGELYASVLEPKKEFDAFVRRCLSSEAEAQSILSNSLYNRITTSLAGSQEFTSIEAVLNKVESQDYDLVILDTPPATNSIEFLQAPQKFYDLFNKDVIAWFSRDTSISWFKQALHSGTKKATKILERLVGKDFLSEIYDFFQVMQVLAPKIQERAAMAQNLFASQNTAFSLVAIYDEVKLREALDLSRSLKRQGYHLQNLFINRVFPFHELEAATDFEEKWQHAYAYQTEVKQRVKDYFSKDLSLFEIEEQTTDIASLDALIKLGQTIDI